MKHAQTKKFLEGIEIMIAVQQNMPFLQAERPNQAIDRPAYGVSAVAQQSVASTASFRTKVESLQTMFLLANSLLLV